MNTLQKIVFALCLTVGAAFGQVNALTATTLSAAVLSTDRTITVTSATGINAPSQGVIGSQLYVIAPGNPRGESMLVQATSSTTITVARGRSGNAGAFPNGSAVLIGQPNYFRAFDPAGGCTAAATFITPHVNTLTGMQWLCSTISLSWVPGWQNPAGPQVTAAVASVAGATAINGPLQHITGTNAITSFTMGVGWNGSGFCVIPDAAFTTTATNNIGKASTAVLNKTLCYTWDQTNSVFTPDY
jgi:hypothetical protein